MVGHYFSAGKTTSLNLVNQSAWFKLLYNLHSQLCKEQELESSFQRHLVGIATYMKLLAWSKFRLIVAG